MNEKIKVVWLCHFSNVFVHERLDLRYNRLIGFMKRLVHKPLSTDVPEFAKWITNGINEFEKIEDVELHVVSPYPYLKTGVQEFKANGINYHFFRNEDDNFFVFLYKQLFHPSYYDYKRNRRVISRIISDITPDIIHLFGAEIPSIALGMLSISNDIITIAQLQTLMSEPAFKDNYPISDKEYKYRSGVERLIIKKASFLGTLELKYRQFILSSINPNAVFLNTGLALNEPIFTEDCEKKYDFVYFSADISKAADLAIEAFALAHRHNQQITLDIIGGYDDGYKQYLDGLINKREIAGAVKFEGKLPTHKEVLAHIRESKYALLPLKIDLISSTIREAMSNGLPVITTDTGEMGTQRLNIKRKSVLISPVGDHQALAKNMLLLLEDKELSSTIRKNAFETRLEARSNEMTAKKYVDAYKICIDNIKRNCALPDRVTKI